MDDPVRLPASRLAFDIDGVVADTISTFVNLAHRHYGLVSLSKEDISDYDLYSCLDLDRSVIDELICLTLDDDHTRTTRPMPGAVQVLTSIGKHQPLRFVTARIWPESIENWLRETLPTVPAGNVQVFATGSPDSKLEVLRSLGIQYFLEDRLETCRMLYRGGVNPLLFDQPWNRRFEDCREFPRIENWAHLQRLISWEN